MFDREVHYAVNLIFQLKRKYPTVQLIEKKHIMFYTLRTLELYHRTKSISNPSECKMWIAVCYWIVHKFFFSVHLYSLEQFGVAMRETGSIQSFKKYFIKNEMRIQTEVKWLPVLHSLFDYDGELSFKEPWQQSKDSVRPANYDGPLAADVIKAVKTQLDDYLIVVNVHRLARWHNTEDFFVSVPSELKDQLKRMHAAVVGRCSIDGVFCSVLKAYIAERYFGVQPSWIPTVPHALCPPIGVVNEYNKEMVLDLRLELVRQLREMKISVSDVHDSIEGEVSQEFYSFASEKLKTAAELKDYTDAAMKAICAIYPLNLNECTNLSCEIDKLILDTVLKLKRSSSALLGKRKESMPPPDPIGEDGIFKRTVAEKMHLMCTRVSKNNCVTPRANVLHEVHVIPAAVKVVTTTYQRKQGSFRSEVVKVEVSGNFASACDALAEAYVTRSRATDARCLAAQASEMEARASADDRKTAAVAADDAARLASDADIAAAAAAAAAVAAEDAEVAAAAAKAAAEAIP